MKLSNIITAITILYIISQVWLIVEIRQQIKRNEQLIERLKSIDRKREEAHARIVDTAIARGWPKSKLGVE
jgi:preprotein translocase subunit YajC